MNDGRLPGHLFDVVWIVVAIDETHRVGFV